MRAALEIIIKVVQWECLGDEIARLEANQPCKRLANLNPFLRDGVLRVGGRLSNAPLPYGQKHPYLLPRHALVDLLIVAYHEEYLHVGPSNLQAILRTKFWLINGRSSVRKITRNCVTCFRVKPKLAVQLMGELPSCRVTPSEPFEITGVDYAGPVYVKQGRYRPKIVKAYIGVFVCMVTRAVHLELISDMTTGAFIAALHRFVGRRGPPREIHSDNGSNFRGAKTELHEMYLLLKSQLVAKEIDGFCQPKEISWFFIPPESPNFGGLWEAAVKSVKYHLKRTLKTAHLTFEEYVTVLAQVEAVLNSRPLSVGCEPDDPQVFTPAHFAVGRSLTSISEPSYMDTKVHRLNRWQYTQRLREEIWRKWKSDYLLTLQRRGKNKVRQTNVQPGMIVLLEERNAPPLHWSLGRIVKVYPGTDNLVRTVDVQIGDSVYKRAISKIAVLPIKDNQVISENPSQPGGVC